MSFRHNCGVNLTLFDLIAALPMAYALPILVIRHVARLRVTQAALPHQIASGFFRTYLNTMKNHIDSDTSSEAEYESSQGSMAGSNYDEDEPSQDLEPNTGGFYDEYENVPWNPDAQLQAQLHNSQLAKLHTDIKA